MNNTIKVVKRIGYGYHNFRNFCTCILATVNEKAGGSLSAISPLTLVYFLATPTIDGEPY